MTAATLRTLGYGAFRTRRARTLRIWSSALRREPTRNTMWARRWTVTLVWSEAVNVDITPAVPPYTGIHPSASATVLWQYLRPQDKGRLHQRRWHHPHGVHRHGGGPGQCSLRPDWRCPGVADHGDLEFNAGPGPGGQLHNQRVDRRSGYSETPCLPVRGGRDAGRGGDHTRCAHLQRPGRGQRLWPGGDGGGDLRLQPARAGGHHGTAPRRWKSFSAGPTPSRPCT